MLGAGEGGHSSSSRHAGIRGRRRAHAAPAIELAEAQGAHPGQPSLGHLLVKRPVAVIALVPKSAVLFAAGAVAGALGMAAHASCMPHRVACMHDAAACMVFASLFIKGGTNAGATPTALLHRGSCSKSTFKCVSTRCKGGTLTNAAGACGAASAIPASG